MPSSRRDRGPSMPLRLAVLANLLGSVAGGRVLSAGKGLTDLRLLGSGSLMALLAGAVLSLLVLDRARRVRSGHGLVWVSGASVACSSGLLLLYQFGRSVSPATGAVFTGPVALLFFALLSLRCACWFAARSLRTGLVASRERGLLGLAEAAYFLGLVLGLVMGLPAWLGGDPVASAFVLDLGLLSAVTIIDSRTAGQAGQIRSATRPLQLDMLFVRFTAAYAAATIACQIVVFHLADNLARLATAEARAWADPSLAAFYVGVAAVASNNQRLKALLQAERGRARVTWHAGARRRGLALPALCVMVGLLVVAGTTLVWTGAGRLVGGRVDTGEASGAARALIAGGLAAIAVGSGLFELLMLALLDGLSGRGQNQVALTLAIAGGLATVAMFLMLLAGGGHTVRAVAAAAGLAATVTVLQAPPPPGKDIGAT